MNDAFHIAATGMQAQQLNVETIANNLANVNTTGFKKSRVSFVDLVQAAPRGVAGDANEPASAGAGMRSGAGVGIAQLARLFDAGDMRKTDAPLDLAIDGIGFIEVALPDGAVAYSRGGSFRLGRDGQLLTEDGLPVKTGIVVPPGAQELRIGRDGRVLARLAGQAGPVELGQLELVRFANPLALALQGDKLYRATDAAGEALPGKAGDDGMGAFMQGMLEASNVSLVDEMVGLMVAQRAYEASVKLVQAADEMSALVNGLRR